MQYSFIASQTKLILIINNIIIDNGCLLKIIPLTYRPIGY